jgi:hypothetical protein
MRMLTAIAAGLALALLGAAGAAAKEVTSAMACGADGCTRIDGPIGRAAIDGGPPGDAPRRAAPFFRLRLGIGAGEGAVEWLTNVYVPSARKLRGDDGTWMDPSPASLNALDRLVQGTKPFPAAQLALPAAAARRTAAVDPPSTSGADGTPVGTWVLLAAGALGLLGALFGATRSLGRRRRGGGAAGG